MINNDVAVMAANAKSILFGALDKYLIRDTAGITLLRLDERFADFHQVAFLAFSRHDGDLLNAGTNPVKHYANSAQREQALLGRINYLRDMSAWAGEANFRCAC